MDFFVELFSGISDPRVSNRCSYPLSSLLAIGLLGSLCGIDSFSGLADYAEMHFDFLSEYLFLPDRPPSHDTFRTVFSMIDPAEFVQKFHIFTEFLADQMSDVIPIDGKTICNSGDSPLHIVHAWCSNNGLVLAQRKTNAKSNEITAIPQLLDLLNLSGTTITIDAMGCQRDICQKILDKDADYTICVKANQKTLFEDIRDYFQDQHLLETTLQDANYDKAHGRLEERIAYSTDDIDWLQENHDWPGLKSIGMITRNVRTLKNGQEKYTSETRYFISSEEANPVRLNEVVRKHWQIENSLHWVLDVVYNEDKACICDDHAAENMSILRKWALNILNKIPRKTSTSIKSLQRKNLMNSSILLNSLKFILHA